LPACSGGNFTPETATLRNLVLNTVPHGLKIDANAFLVISTGRLPTNIVRSDSSLSCSFVGLLIDLVGVSSVVDCSFAEDSLSLLLLDESSPSSSFFLSSFFFFDGDGGGEDFFCNEDGITFANKSVDDAADLSPEEEPNILLTNDMITVYVDDSTS